MKIMRRFFAGALLLLIASLPALAAQPSGKELDRLYGVSSTPAYVKHYEVDKKSGKFWLHPYLQVASAEHPAILDPAKAPYNWVMDTDGNVRINRESVNPYGRKYEKGYIRPEDNSRRKPGTTEKDGHVSTLGGEKGRIGGEFLYDKESKTWTINNKSGRYSNHNPDRTPEQLQNAAEAIKKVVNPGPATWGDVIYLVRYAPKDGRAKILADPKIQYNRPDKKELIEKDPYLLLGK